MQPELNALQYEYAERTRRDGGALIWVPRRTHGDSGQYMAWFPERDDHEFWLKVVCRIRTPEFDEADRWLLPRSTLNKVVRAALDEYGSVGMFLDVEGKLRDCDARCQNARNLDCVCGCLGANHGTEPTIQWVQVSDAEVVWQRDALRRIFRLHTPFAVEGVAKVYAGELKLIEYIENHKQRERSNWPRASEFECASCSKARASVWDHCHTHGYVRAPLCHPCNTWHWSGWGYDVRRAKRADISYLELCPDRSSGRCSQ